MAKLLSTAYFPSVSYFAAMAQEMDGLIKCTGDRRVENPASITPSVIYLEACENFQKQSYRNRCHILGGDGVQSLSFPILHKNGTHKIPIKEIQIDWKTAWSVQHQRAIISAYRSSAFFEYYQDELFEIFRYRPETLFEMNYLIIDFFIRKIGLAVDLRMTTDFVEKGCFDGEDLRDVIHPKRPNDILKELGLTKPYFQVFSDRWGFKEDLSIMDLLFNMGPETISYLKNL